MSARKKITITFQPLPITSNTRFQFKKECFSDAITNQTSFLCDCASYDFQVKRDIRDISLVCDRIHTICDTFAADTQQCIETVCNNETIANLKQINENQEDKIKILEDQIKNLQSILKATDCNNETIANLKQINENQEDKIKILEDQIKNLQSILKPVHEIVEKIHFLTNRSDTKNVTENLQETIKK